MCARSPPPPRDQHPCRHTLVDMQLAALAQANNCSAVERKYELAPAFAYTHRQGLQPHTLRDYNTSSVAVPKLMNTRERLPVKIVKQSINNQVYFTNTIP